MLQKIHVSFIFWNGKIGYYSSNKKCWLLANFKQIVVLRWPTATNAHIVIITAYELFHNKILLQPSAAWNSSPMHSKLEMSLYLQFPIIYQCFSKTVNNGPKMCTTWVNLIFYQCFLDWIGELHAKRYTIKRTRMKIK